MKTYRCKWYLQTSKRTDW